MLKITVGQINPTVGDMVGNIALMLGAARRARHDESRMVVFPELSLTGYYPGDLLDDALFLQRMDAALKELLLASRETPDLFWVVGAPTHREGSGKRLHNSLLVVRDGRVVLTYSKQLLPTYNVFDERRHFEPGPDVARVLNVDGTQVGFIVCEDAWNDDSADYRDNPLQRVSDSAPDLIVSINASPSNIGKREQRHSLFTKVSSRHRIPVLYVNQVGGQDQLVYDGASFAVTPSEGVTYEAARFEECVETLTFENGRFSDRRGAPLPRVDKAGMSTNEFYFRQISLGLADYARRCGFARAVVGSSGGIDSALTLALAVNALGAHNVSAITMPSEYSSSGSVDDSVLLCENLGVQLHTHPIKAAVLTYREGFQGAFERPLVGLPLENLQARIRGTILMEFSNSFGHLLLTTGNKSELSVGYCTLYGDTNGGLGLIGDLFKTEVTALSRYVNERAGRELIPVSIIDKAPSAELAPDQKDTDSLPPYPVLDPLLMGLIEGGRLSDTERAASQEVTQRLQSTADGAATITRIKHLIARNEYKRRQAPPILRVRGTAFGAGRQMPIAAVHY